MKETINTENKRSYCAGCIRYEAECKERHLSVCRWYMDHVIINGEDLIKCPWKVKFFK